MCGRYAIAPSRTDAWASVGEVLGGHIEVELAALKARYNIAPTEHVPIVIQDAGTREFRAELARWGFVPSWWKQEKPPQSTINARSEDAGTKPMWRSAYRNARCLVPATHWYEWQRATGGKVPHALTVAAGAGFMFAGFWSRWRPSGEDREAVLTCAVLTRDASSDVSAVHDRMPVILHPIAWVRWLDPAVRDPEHVREILSVNAVLEARVWPVSRRVNNPTHQDPDCLDPVEPDQ